MNPSGITLASLLNTAVHTVTPDTPIDQALALMSSHRISCVVVVDHDTPVGIFTEQDSVALLARGKYEVLLPIRSVMREPLLVSRLSMEHHRAYQMMVTRNTRHLVAVDADGRLLGLVTEGDLLHVIGLEQLIQPKSVADAMTRQVVSHDENDTLSAAAQHMTERALSCVVVTRGGLPVGMLSARDAVRLSQGGTVPESTLLSQIMSQPLLTVVADELLAVAMRHMETAGVRRLVVVDGQNRLVGLITRHDIVKTLQEHYLDSLRDTICRLERDLDATRNRLQSVEHRLLERSVLDQVNDAVLVIELDTGRVVEANELAHEFLGQRHDQLLNLHGYDFLELFLDENAWREWAQSFPERSMQLEETRLRMQGGSWLPVEASLRHVRSEGRAFVVLVARDITERKAQEARIRLDREQQRALREILEIGIGDGDLKDRLGRCLDRLLSVSWLNLLPKAGIFDLPADGGGLRLVAQRNLPGELLVRCARVPLGVCLCGRAAQLGATQFSHCVDQRHDIAFPGMADHGHYNLPLLAGEEVLGVLVLYLPHDHPHLREEQEFLEATADALAILLRRDRVEAALVENRNRLADSESRIRELLDSTAEAIFAVDLDDRCTLVNRACLNMLGYAQPEELLGQRIHELIHHHHADGRFYPAEACKALPSQLGLQCTRVHVDDEVFWHRDGSQIPVEYWSHPILRDGRLAGAVVTFLDITQRRQSEESLRLAAKVFENTQDGVMITDADSRIVSVNNAFSEITGYAAAEAVGQSADILNSGNHGSEFYEAMWRALRESYHWQGEVWNRTKSGQVFPARLAISTVHDQRGRVTNYVGVFSDISQIKHSEAQLEYLAHHDPLTDLPNRILFQTRLAHAIQVARRHDQRLALLFLDMDGFKHVNDSLGHPAGDELLQAVARRMTEHLRRADTLARLGGDEFVILMENLQDGREAAIVAKNVLKLLSTPFHLSSRDEVFIGGSIGISLFPDDAEDATGMVRNADAAMYQAKAQGRNTYRFYTEALTRTANERLRLESNLRRALENQEFLLHYQPQVSLSDGRLIGAEALVRWQAPDGGLVPPGQFIPIAEETGLIRQLGEWVLQTACAQFQSWRRAGLPDITLAVNLSSRQFEQRDLAERIAYILAQTDFPANRLDLEITESAIMEQGQQAIDTLDKLKRLGVSLAIDDFGTGYSSLAYLKRFAVDKLKIDQSFIRDIPHDTSDKEIAATIVAMARNLKLSVLAEGVETEEQLAFLRLHECDAFQGYLYSPPVNSETFAQILARAAHS